jgi:hypothetical protein
MNNSQHNPMRKRYASATAILLAVAIMITIPFNGMLPSTAVAQQQRINSNTSSSQSASKLDLILLKCLVTDGHIHE